MIYNKKCHKCEKVLTDENWRPSDRKTGNYICKYCHREQARLWREKNPEKNRAINTRARRKNGHLPMSENKDCSQYLGITVNERLIRHHFKNIKVMPVGYPGYDFICNKNMKIDAKSSCLNASGRWIFAINRNTEADYFLCVAYDDREHLNILHVWMIPGKDVNDHQSISIRPSNVHKWDKYIYDIEGFSACCNTMKNGGE